MFCVLLAISPTRAIQTERNRVMRQIHATIVMGLLLIARVLNADVFRPRTDSCVDPRCRFHCLARAW